MPDIKHFDPAVVLERVETLFWRRGPVATSIQVIATATGLNRSSLYATFGGKRELYLAALRRYLRHRARPALEALARDERGMPAIRDFFAGLVEERCSSERAGWGCMVVNAHVGDERDDPDVRAELDEHYKRLHDALQAALEVARRRGQLSAGVSADSAATLLSLLTYGVNVRSRAGVDAGTLRGVIEATMAVLVSESEGHEN